MNPIAVTMTLVMMSFLLSACQPSRFESRKREALSKQVFNGDQYYGDEPDGADGSITQPPGPADGAGGSIPQPPGPADGAGGSIPQPPGPSDGSGGSIPQPPGPTDGSGGSIPQPTGPTDGSGGNIPQPTVPTDGSGGNVPQPTAPGTPIIPVRTVCSALSTGQTGTNGLSAAALKLVVKDSSGATVCELTQGVKEKIASNRSIDFSACQLSGTSYTAQLVDPAKPSANLFYAVASNNNFDTDHVVLKRQDTSSRWTATPKYSDVYTGGINAGSSQIGVLWGSPLKGELACDVLASPLVINMTPAGAHDPGMLLSRPSDGVLFDILGLNARPYPHAKQRISWIHNPNYMFLALPRFGRVNGIDQLFGDNTYGPDHQFATDGFAALAKYDINYDGVIDAEDPIFDHLKLWSDTNADGVSHPTELHSLAEKQIEEIDLNYDPTYFEQDQYGNQSRMRSTVRTSDDRLQMIFDLWFALP